MSEATNVAAPKRRQALRNLMKSGAVSLAFAATMAEEDTALGSLSVMSLMRLNTDVTVAHARYALTVAGLSTKTSLRDINAETADVLVAASAEAQVEGNPTLHYPFWSEPDEPSLT